MGYRNFVLTLLALSFFITTAAWVAINFLFINLCGGQVEFREPSVALRTFEFFASMAIFVLAVERWINFVRRKG